MRRTASSQILRPPQAKPPLFSARGALHWSVYTVVRSALSFHPFPPSVPPFLPYGRTQKFVEPLMYGRKHQLPPCPLPLHGVGNEFQLILFPQCGFHTQWAWEHVMHNHSTGFVYFVWSPSESQMIFSSHARSLWAVQITELTCFWPLLAGIVQFLKVAIFSPWGQRKKSFRPDLGFGQVEP